MSRSRSYDYRKFVRWYPAEWRERNEEAILGVMMDEDEAKGRLVAPMSDRLALVIAGLHQRVFARQRLSTYNLAALVSAALFSFWYLGVITWAPGITYVGTVGPFSNPTVIAGAIVVVALILGILNRGRTARFIAMIAAIVMVSLGILAPIYSWLGPGMLAVAIFVGLGLIAASPLRSVRDAMRVAASFVLIIAGIILTQFALASATPAFSPVSVAEAAGAACAFLGAAILAWPTARSFRRKPLPA
jgi:hypothetical protein